MKPAPLHFRALGSPFSLVLRGELATFYSATGKPFGFAVWTGADLIDPSAMHPDVVTAAVRALSHRRAA